MSIDLDALLALSRAEKLRIIEALWEDLEASDEPPQIHPSVLEEAERRHAELIADPSKAISHEEMWRRLERLCE